ncbi:MAG TPA: PDZ domain-containing protein, partial [Candidatus Nanoarchaeia archaeon]|nr:PDZ domain-containing protein [Candidatus Nanoarchaeia archaeon]
MKIKLTFRIWLWIIILLLALIAILNFSNLFQNGVIIKSVEQNSSAFEQGLRQDQIITAIDGEKINNVEDFLKIINDKFISREKVKITITTSKAEYPFYSDSPPEIIVSDLSKTNIKTGLDLSGGARALIQAEDRPLTQEESNTLVDMLNNRFNVYGISDMTIRSVRDLENHYFVLIEIAGATPKDL